MHRKTLAALVLVAGAIVWTLAKELTDNRLGALPTLIIVGPFIYLATRLWRSQKRSSTELQSQQLITIDKLKRAADNESLSAEIRAEASRRLEELQSRPRTYEPLAQTERQPSTPSASEDDPHEQAERARGANPLILMSVTLIALLCAGVWWHGQFGGALVNRPPVDTATASPEVPATTDSSAFARQAFDGISISVPRDWRPIGVNDTRSLNTASEALSGSAQGNNTILWAANALDDSNVTRATMRISVRDVAPMTQDDLRGALKQPQEQTRAELMEAAEQGAVSAKKLTKADYYNVTDAGLRDNGSIVCTWVEYEYDIGKGPTIFDLWVCPSSTRTYKLATSYAKDRAALYSATIDHSWRSLSFEPMR